MCSFLLYEGRLKSSWTGGSEQLLCFPLHNSGALPPVHKLFKRPSYIQDVFRRSYLRHHKTGLNHVPTYLLFQNRC